MGQKIPDWDSLSRPERIAIVSGLIAVLCGFISFLVGPDPAPTGQPSQSAPLGVHGAILRTLQLFVLQLGPESLNGLLGWIAVFAAPIATALGAASLLDRMVQAAMDRPEKVDDSKLTDLFLGGGRMAAEIAQSLLINRSDSWVRCLDVSATCILGNSAHARQLPMMVGSATSPSDLLRAGIGKATRVWVVCGSDELQLKVLGALKGLEPGLRYAEQTWLIDMESRSMVHAAEVMVHRTAAEPTAKPAASDAAADKTSRTSGTGHPKIEYFNQERLAVRRLFRRHGPDIRSPKDAPLHVAVLGTGPLAQAIVLHAIQHLVLHHAPAHAVRVSWFGVGTEHEWQQLQLRYPALDDRTPQPKTLADLLPLGFVSTFEVDETVLPLGCWQQTQAEQPFSVVYAAAQDSVRTAIAARQATRLQRASGLTPGHGASVMACYHDAPPPHHEVGVSFEAEAAERSGFTPFWVFENVLQAGEDYPGKREDSKSVRAKKAKGESEWNIWSARCRDDHEQLIADRLAVHGTFSVDQIYDIEHRRFIVERLLDGWLPISAEVQSALGEDPEKAKAQARAEHLSAELRSEWKRNESHKNYVRRRQAAVETKART